MSVNKVILVGRLGRDPETRYTSGGQAVANFSVATDESYKDRNGERQKRTEWHKIVVWGKQAEIAQQYLKKGSLVFIEGRIQSREWQDKEGQKRTSFEIVASNFRMLGGRGEGGGMAAGAGRCRRCSRRRTRSIRPRRRHFPRRPLRPRNLRRRHPFLAPQRAGVAPSVAQASACVRGRLPYPVGARYIVPLGLIFPPSSVPSVPSVVNQKGTLLGS